MSINSKLWFIHTMVYYASLKEWRNVSCMDKEWFPRKTGKKKKNQDAEQYTSYATIKKLVNISLFSICRSLKNSYEIANIGCLWVGKMHSWD